MLVDLWRSPGPLSYSKQRYLESYPRLLKSWPIRFQCLTTLTIVFFSLYLVRISPCVTVVPCPFAMQHCQEWVSVLLITTCQDSWTEQTAPPWPLCTARAPAPRLLWWASAELTSTWHRASELAFQVLCRGKKTFFSLLASLLLIQPSML